VVDVEIERTSECVGLKGITSTEFEGEVAMSSRSQRRVDRMLTGGIVFSYSSRALSGFM